MGLEPRNIDPTFLFDFNACTKYAYLAPLSHSAHRGRRQTYVAIGIGRLGISIAA